MDDSWVLLANWMTACAVLGGFLVLFLSRPARGQKPGEAEAAVSARYRQLVEDDIVRALLDAGRECVLRPRAPSEVETLELYDEDGHRKRYEGLYVLYLPPADAATASQTPGAE